MHFLAQIAILIVLCGGFRHAGLIPANFNFLREALNLWTYPPALYAFFIAAVYKYHFTINRLLNTINILVSNNTHLKIFLLLSLFKGIKIIIHTFSFYLLSRTPNLIDSTPWKSDDVTVIVPTIGHMDSEFQECIKSILAAHPHEVIIAIVGNASYASTVCSTFQNPTVRIVSVPETNKRRQFLEAAKSVKTNITCYADDHVFWPRTFLRSALIPFGDPLVGLVGTAKRVIRNRSGTLGESFLNYLACIYLERHNFECTASYNLDGGVFVISGRTALVRTDIIHSRQFQEGYLHEHWWCGNVGPMKVDDDNFITRFMVKKGFKTVFWNHPEALVYTTLGTVGGWDKFRGQLMRWARTTFRSNSTSLFVDRVCWWRYPWTTIAMFITSFINIAVIYDSALVFYLYKGTGTQYLIWLVLVLLATKLIKPLPHLVREPKDIPFWFGGILFGYYHSLLRIWAFITARNIEWSGRVGIPTTGEE